LDAFAFGRELSTKDLAKLEARGIKVSFEGITLLGSPIGTEDYVTRFVEAEVESVRKQLDKITSVDTIGKLNLSKASEQGVYQMVRDCINQSLRHLMRTVDPRVIEKCLAPLDTLTRQVIRRLFDISEDEASEIVMTRIGLPGRMGGMGIMSYEVAAAPAFLGAIAAVGPRLKDGVCAASGVGLDDIPGAREAYELLRSELPEGVLQPEDEFFVEPVRAPGQRGGLSLEEVGAPRRKNTVQWKLTAARLELRHETMKAKAAEKEEDKYIVQQTSNSTCADFLFLQGFRRNSLRASFKIAVRNYLGLPVTSTICNIGSCCNEPVHPNGEHAKHAQRLATVRHTRVNLAIGSVFRKQHASGACAYRVDYETSMSTLGFSPKEGAKRPDVDAKVDFYLKNDTTGHIFFTDVKITHPVFWKEANRSSEAALDIAVAGKYITYLGSYDIPEADVIPLVFTSYGGYAKVTYDFLKQMCVTIADNDHKLADRLFRELRNQIAVAIHSAQGEIINYLNCRNRASKV